VEEQVEEFFFVGLRQVEGINLDRAAARWGARYIDRWGEKIQSLAQEGWVIRQGARLRLARHAYLVSNEIFQEFVSA
jgi:oxygen-independent coproporphyrinogen-3 oxidase